MNGKTAWKRMLAACLMLLMVICLAACGSENKDAGTTESTGTENTTAATEAPAGDKYVNEGESFAIKTADLPEGYPLIPEEQFKAAFKGFTDGTITTASTYEDIAKAFGNEGIAMKGIHYDGYAYYGWYCEKDYLSDTKTYVLVTFKVNGDTLNYYAYSSLGITADDVK